MIDVIGSIYERIENKNFSHTRSILQEMIDVSSRGQPTMDDLLLRISDVFLSQSLALQRTLVDPDGLVRDSDRRRGISISRKAFGRIMDFYTSMVYMWSEERYLHNIRITDIDDFERKLAVNGTRAYLDIVGMRIVPKNYEDFFKVLSFFEAHSFTRCCMVNTFLFRGDDFKRYISANSSASYRAVHYLLEIEGVPVELQVRTRGVDIWAKIHHATVYRPVVSITPNERECIDRFGEIASYMDCFKLIQCT